MSKREVDERPVEVYALPPLRQRRIARMGHPAPKCVAKQKFVVEPVASKEGLPALKLYRRDRGGR
jgi:hypothetical protein